MIRFASLPRVKIPHLLADKKIPHDAPFFDLPDEDPFLIEKFALPFRGKFKSYVVVGLGGATLGTQAICRALLPNSENIHFLDNLDHDLFDRVSRSINPKNTLFFFVSKSGETFETLLLLRNIVQKFYSIVITEEKRSPLFDFARKQKLHFFPHPKNIGGRFSVLSAVSLLPAFIFGLKIREMLEGAASVKKHFLHEKPLRNLPIRFTALIDSLFRRHKKTCVLFTYESRLEKFCEWVIQLLAESLGKKGKGILPVISKGPKDQHSLLQLFLEGPNDAWFLFFPPQKSKFSSHTKTQMENVIKNLKNKNREVLEFKIPPLNEHVLGELFFFVELQTVLLAKLWGINPFTQDAIENVKKMMYK